MNVLFINESETLETSLGFSIPYKHSFIYYPLIIFDFSWAHKLFNWRQTTALKECIPPTMLCSCRMGKSHWKKSLSRLFFFFLEVKEGIHGFVMEIDSSVSFKFVSTCQSRGRSTKSKNTWMKCLAVGAHKAWWRCSRLAGDIYFPVSLYSFYTVFAQIQKEKNYTESIWLFQDVVQGFYLVCLLSHLCLTLTWR